MPIFTITAAHLYTRRMRETSSPTRGLSPLSTIPATCNTASISFAVSRGHNYGGQDFATTYFNGPSNVQFALNQTDPYRPNLQPVNTSIYNPATYSIASTELPNYRSVELDYEGSASLARRYNLGSHFSTFEMGFLVRNAHKTQNENDQFYNATGDFPMSQLLSGHTNPNYYDGTFVSV